LESGIATSILGAAFLTVEVIFSVDRLAGLLARAMSIGNLQDSLHIFKGHFIPQIT
jgi:hypothetical protein